MKIDLNPPYHLDSDFIVVGDCIGRPRGWKRVVIDLVCRLTGHLLWRNLHTIHQQADGSLPLYGSRCRRCFKFGYIEGDYRPIEQKPRPLPPFPAGPLVPRGARFPGGSSGD